MLTADPDTLPYFVTDAQSGIAVPVAFQKVTEADAVELRSSEWQKATYADFWPECVRVERTLKLLAAGEENGTIQGMVRVGKVEAGSIFLSNSLLESAPQNNYDAPTRRYRGVGRVLVARLVVESYLAEQQGRVLISLGASTNKQFYPALGFVKQPHKDRIYRIFEIAAKELLQSALRVP